MTSIILFATPAAVTSQSYRGVHCARPARHVSHYSVSLAEKVGFESTSKRNFRELREMMSIPRHSKKPIGIVIAP